MLSHGRKRNPSYSESLDIEVHLNREDLLKGKDTQLEKAIELLEQELRNTVKR